jgi:uncharacterized protein (TIGR02996 family)
VAQVVVYEGEKIRWSGAMRSRETRVRLGRGATMDIRIRADRVSTVQGHLELRGRRLFISDDASTEGIFVNEGRVLGPTPITSADEIRIVSVLLRVEVMLDEGEMEGPDTKEEEFLEVIRKNPKDNDTRLVYADWLEEHGHPKRAELLRLQCGLDEVDEHDDQQVKRMELKLEALSPQDEAWWRTLISRSPIDKCEVLPDFKFKCPKRWSQLTPTPRDTIRFCESCQREVFFCSSLSDIRYRASRAECVAFDSSLRRKRALTVYDETDQQVFEMGEVG